MTLQDIGAQAKLDDNRTLYVPDNSGQFDTREISVVYLRAGYGPGDYPSDKEWQTRKLLELSRAIKCPTIITQLAGCKKIQQVLASPDVLERYISLFLEITQDSSMFKGHPN
jgi:glutathione synthase